MNFVPNTEQQKAILFDENRPLFITAAPGSGKTRVLLWRTVYLITEKNISPDRIFLSTFTEKAAHQLKEGLRELLNVAANLTDKKYDLARMYIGTIHSNCRRILMDRSFSVSGERKLAPHILDELGQYLYVQNRRFWDKMLQTVGFDAGVDTYRQINNFLARPQEKNSGSRHIALVNILRFFNRLSEELADPAQLKSNDAFINVLYGMYTFYIDSLTQDNVPRTDLSLLQANALKVLKASNGDVKQFDHTIIDEYQDTNAVQENLVFTLAKKTKNLCVVGDDDQALYRFRGATVENFVDFPQRCQKYYKVMPAQISLHTNYRSLKPIIDVSQSFIQKINWTENGKTYRIAKRIKPNRKGNVPAVFKTDEGHPDDIVPQMAKFIRHLKQQGVINDYNQVAVLFSYLKGNGQVQRLSHALEQEGILTYAPRAGCFLDLEESLAVFGLFAKILGLPSLQGQGRQMGHFRDWLDRCKQMTDDLISNDSPLKDFIVNKQTEIKRILNDHRRLMAYWNGKVTNLRQKITAQQVRDMANISGLSQEAVRKLSSDRLLRIVQLVNSQTSIVYVINRVTSLDWGLLDLFYQFTMFKYFRDCIKKAEYGKDEGPICNLALITQYLSRYQEERRRPILTALDLTDDRLHRHFFMSYLFAMYRLGETEFEDKEDPFPKGRVSLITIHQAKGLEFPVVILGSLYRQNRGIDIIEKIVREELNKKGEPLDKMSEFDNLRLFYVALSRAQNVLLLPRFRGRGQRMTPAFREILEEDIPHLSTINWNQVKKPRKSTESVGCSYSFTSDYLAYKRCSRQYMLFRKYGFVPARSQVMFFGSLVHQTIEDLHNHILLQKAKV